MYIRHWTLSYTVYQIVNTELYYIYGLTLLICTTAKILLGDWASISALTCSRVSAGGQDGHQTLVCRLQIIVMYTQVEVRGSCINSLPAFVELHLRQCARCWLGGIGNDEENLWVEAKITHTFNLFSVLEFSGIIKMVSFYFNWLYTC